MRKPWYPVVVIGALLAALLTGAPAYAAGAVLTTGSAGGTDVAPGDTATAGLLAGTTSNLYSSATGTTGIKCSTSSFTATVDTNPAAPGVASETLTAQTFSGCTANIVGVTSVRSVTIDHLPYTTTVSSDGSVALTAGAAGAIQTTVVLNSLLGAITCVYQVDGGTLVGASDNTTNAITFANRQFNKVGGSVACFANGFFTATYAPVTDQTAGGAAIFVN
jgi:hypothetical protein